MENYQEGEGLLLEASLRTVNEGVILTPVKMITILFRAVAIAEREMRLNSEYNKD